MNTVLRAVIAFTVAEKHTGTTRECLIDCAQRPRVVLLIQAKVIPGATLASGSCPARMSAAAGESNLNP